ncbi:MAG: cell envelope biogenesis protein TolA [Pseudorhodoplanes sp.]
MRKLARIIKERMRVGLTISAVGHIAIVLWAVITFVSKPLNAKTDSVAVDIISAEQFSKMTTGRRDAPKAEAAKPFVEKVGEQKQIEPTNAKVTNRQVESTAEAMPAAPKEEKKPEKKEAKAEPKPDPIAEALKKEEVKKPEEKKTVAKPTPTPPKKPVPTPPKYDPVKIASLLNKQDGQRLAVTGATINNKPPPAGAIGDAAVLSQNEIDALIARLRSNWSPPPGGEDVAIRIIVRLNRDGRLSVGPQFASSGTGPLFDAARASALRAVLLSAPFDMLRQETYESWAELDLVFDRTLLAGR